MILNVKVLGLVFSEKKIFKIFSYITIFKTDEPPNEAPFYPMGILLKPREHSLGIKNERNSNFPKLK